MGQVFLDTLYTYLFQCHCRNVSYFWKEGAQIERPNARYAIFVHASDAANVLGCHIQIIERLHAIVSFVRNGNCWSKNLKAGTKAIFAEKESDSLKKQLANVGNLKVKHISPTLQIEFCKAKWSSDMTDLFINILMRYTLEGNIISMWIWGFYV